jgi:5-methylthioadenosine/S-adenosylhomocysteine deaminase
VPGPIDPANGGTFALRGRVVTMDQNRTVLDDGVVYVRDGGVLVVQPAAAAAPGGFPAAPTQTGGTIYPGLIELHNHLSYNALQLWQVPKLYGDRGQWGRTPEYAQAITGPMDVIGRSPSLLPAVIRYVEAKCLVSGVTTSQGVALFSNAGVRRYYRGIVRNVEQTKDPNLPAAATRIADVDAKSAIGFKAQLHKHHCCLLHLAEGTDPSAHMHFESLHLQDGSWALAASLAGIHCAALQPTDFDVLAEHHASMVWSPFSNFLLYGKTADVKAAKAAGVPIGIGSDWAPSGSKNLLGELKVAKWFSDSNGGVFTDVELVAMATSTAASILGWDKQLGSLEKGKRADLLVLRGAAGDPYGQLIAATEREVQLVVINGTPRYGDTKTMASVEGSGELATIAGRHRKLNLVQAEEDPVMQGITFAAARKTLVEGLADLPKLARAPLISAFASPARGEKPQWFLALDELHATGEELRPRIGATGPPLALTAAAVHAAHQLKPLVLDGLTVIDDHTFLARVAAQPNPPKELTTYLSGLYA